MLKLPKVSCHNGSDYILGYGVIAMNYSVTSINNFSSMAYLYLRVKLQYPICRLPNYFDVSFNSFSYFQIFPELEEISCFGQKALNFFN